MTIEQLIAQLRERAADEDELDFTEGDAVLMEFAADALRTAIAERDEARAERDDKEYFRANCQQLSEIWERRAKHLEARAEAAEARLEEAKAVLGWYGENARLCRLIHSEGDKGRHALADDGGKKASAILNSEHQGGEVNILPQPKP